MRCAKGCAGEAGGWEPENFKLGGANVDVSVAAMRYGSYIIDLQHFRQLGCISSGLQKC